MKKNIIKYRIHFLALLILLSCDDFLHVPEPKDQLVRASVFKDDNTALAAVNGIYEEMIKSNAFASGSLNSVTFIASLSSDDLIYTSSVSDFLEFSKNEVQLTNSTLQSGLWSPAYQYIYDANAIVEGSESSTTMSDAIKRQVTGEAKFIRAFCHFYLNALFGDVPLVTSTDYRINREAPRNSRTQIYEQMITDLLSAKELLPSDYTVYTSQRTRPNSYAAASLLARVYLYAGEWKKAEAEATVVITNTALYKILPNLNDVFLANSNEAIWQLQPVVPGMNTNEGSVFILNNALGNGVISPTLMDSFEQNDLRKSSWTNSLTVDGANYYYPYKYKVRSATQVTEYSMVIRLAELYLIRAEARAHLSDTNGAIQDIDVLRLRAALPLMAQINPSLAGDELLNAIAHERQVELFTEWGHRWLDLHRMGKIDAVMSALKTGWQSTDALYPIPQSEILNNPSLTQNPGY